MVIKVTTAQKTIIEIKCNNKGHRQQRYNVHDDIVSDGTAHRAYENYYEV